MNDLNQNQSWKLEDNIAQMDQSYLLHMATFSLGDTLDNDTAFSNGPVPGRLSQSFYQDVFKDLIGSEYSSKHAFPQHRATRPVRCT